MDKPRRKAGLAYGEDLPLISQRARDEAGREIRLGLKLEGEGHKDAAERLAQAIRDGNRKKETIYLQHRPRFGEHTSTPSGPPSGFFVSYLMSKGTIHNGPHEYQSKEEVRMGSQIWKALCERAGRADKERREKGEDEGVVGREWTAIIEEAQDILGDLDSLGGMPQAWHIPDMGPGLKEKLDSLQEWAANEAGIDEIRAIDPLVHTRTRQTVARLTPLAGSREGMQKIMARDQNWTENLFYLSLLSLNANPHFSEDGYRGVIDGLLELVKHHVDANYNTAKRSMSSGFLAQCAIERGWTVAPGQMKEIELIATAMEKDFRQSAAVLEKWDGHNAAVISHIPESGATEKIRKRLWTMAKAQNVDEANTIAAGLLGGSKGRAWVETVALLLGKNQFMATLEAAEALRYASDALVLTLDKKDLVQLLVTDDDEVRIDTLALMRRVDAARKAGAEATAERATTKRRTGGRKR